MDPMPNIKKIFFYILGGALIIIVLIWIWQYLHTGKIIINTGNPTRTITLAKINDDGTKAAGTEIFKGRGKLSVTVNTGQYVATVEGSSQATVQLIKVGALKTLRYEIDPVKTSGVEPVAYEDALGITANSRELFYVNASSGHLSRINSQNKIVTLNQTVSLQSVKWVDSSFGVGQSSNGHLYIIDNGTFRVLRVPFSYDGAAVNFDVSPNKQIYLSHGADVYTASQGGSFKKIYTASITSLTLAASSSRLAVSGLAFDVEGLKHLSELAVVPTSGKVTKVKAFNVGSGETSALAWSPSGLYLVFPGKTGADIYNSALRKVAIIPVNPIAVRWLNDNTFFYSYNDGLWRYSLSNQRAELIANMPLASLITGLTLSDNQSYIYLTTLSTGAGSNSAIRRVGLRNQSVPKSIYQLQSILPLRLGSCALSLINFTAKPAILVQAAANQSQQCQRAARSELQNRGFDLTSLRITPAT